MSTNKDTNRSGKLRTLFVSVLKGKENITNRNAKLFLEAVSDQEAPATCIQRLAGSPYGFDALRASWSSEKSIAFFNGPAAKFIHYLRNPNVKIVCGGEILRQIISIVVETELIWDSFVEAAKAGELESTALEAFAWLLLELLTFPVENAVEYVRFAQDPAIQDSLLKSPQVQTRLLGQRIVHIACTLSASGRTDETGPGGRHDNDFAEIRNISIIPTADELVSKDPYLPRISDLYEKFHLPEGLALHVDAQFRLLREDMLRDLREEIKAASDPKPTRRRPLIVENLSMFDVLCDERNPWSIQFHCLPDLPQLPKKNGPQRKAFLENNNRFLKHESLACLMVDDEVVTLATILRDDDLLAQMPPVLHLKIPEATVENALLRIKGAKDNVKLIQLNTALFAYEPILKQLKGIKELSLESDIIRWEEGRSIQSPTFFQRSKIQNLIQDLEIDHSIDLRQRLRLPSTTILDHSQAVCLQAGLTQRVTLIQGPPGTGKSFIGSLIAKSIYEFSNETILLVCYTHHAMDQFVEDLLNLGVPEDCVVRLGSTQKATAKTKALSLYEQRRNFKFPRHSHDLIEFIKTRVSDHSDSLKQAGIDFFEASFSKKETLEYLEFLAEGPPYFQALEVPEDGENRVGKRGKIMDKYYLFDRWYRGKDAGIFKTHKAEFRDVWGLGSSERIKTYHRWREEMLRERVVRMRDLGKAYDSDLHLLDSVFLTKDRTIIRSKRIIACTTTAAAKYGGILQLVAPGVLLVEEAGEILESHILTALNPSTEQLILIGDHKQLRPKVHHDLSVEKGDGYDLNRSLFERLILCKYPHQVLHQQHRMRPEISALVRELTYPDLVDAPKTKSKPNLRGFTDNLMFINHHEPETDMEGTPEFVDNTSTSSKRNIFEAKLTLKCVRYLGQQGYRTDNIAVLTPYIGQLRLLLDELAKENDPVLNDLDSHDLVRAGLMPAASASVAKPRIRISTIDNFQGDESDIVVISLTRSNPRHDIGFMSSPERLNVMLSRARETLIMIGDAENFRNARKGAELWQRLFAMLKKGNHIYDGFPVRCERHKDRTGILQRPEDFDTECPDGGCKDPCGKWLNCGAHQCPQRCHQLFDHSKMQCKQEIQFKCANGHTQRRKCFQGKKVSCSQCVSDDKRRQKDLETERIIQEARDKAQLKHLEEMAELDRQIKMMRAKATDTQLADEQMKALEQKKIDLETAKQLLQAQSAPKNKVEVVADKNTQQQKTASMPSKVSQKKKTSKNNLEVHDKHQSPSEMEWERQRTVEGASNAAIDSLMKLTGLERVKEKILDIKAKIEIAARQGLDMRKERLGMVMLGNPGTGKTTVARLYGQFLASINAIPGQEFVEATGSSLANDGIAGTKKKIEDLLKAGGGIFFVDEAYQLASGNNYNGAAVLDFLLAEIEERRGKIAFILAGYKKEMEKFFEHNPGFESRMPHRLIFADYSDKELHTMLVRMIETKYKGRAELEDGLRGLYARILITRLGRRRGKEGYGNARALENVWALVTERQASRILRERAKGELPEDLVFTKEDLIGPEPSQAVQESKAWKELNSLIGLKAVKDAVKALLDCIRLNYCRELEEKRPIEVSLNRIFLGSPGTGKTTVANLYGTILADLGLLSKGEVIGRIADDAKVVLKNPADFVGSVLGESEKNTKAILQATEGKVLVIDEAYMLSPGQKGGPNSGDIYRTAVIDTMVAEIQNTPGEDRCVLLLGYRKEMEEMLRNANPGFARRFPLESAFQFDDFNDSELLQVLDLKMKKQGLEATGDAKNTAIALLSRLRDRPNFGNAGAVENLLSSAKERWQKRASSSKLESFGADILLEPRDFDENFDRVESSAMSVKELFSDIVGCAGVVDKFQKFQKTATVLKAKKKDPREFIPFNFIFKGPPGTGKTTVARKIAELFYNIGILPTKDYSECSAADLVAPYVGQSGSKTREALKAALGRVLFVDEAYRLQDSDFGKEAANEIVDCLTKPDFMGKLVVILAGYTEDMNSLLRLNAGLASRFSEEVIFENMKPDDCLCLLKRQLKQADLDITPDLDDMQSNGYQSLSCLVQKLSNLPSWGNGRDIKTLSNRVAFAAFESADPNSTSVKVSTADIIRALDLMLNEQNARSKTKSNDARAAEGLNELSKLLAQTAIATPAPKPSIVTTTKSAVKEEQKELQNVENIEAQKPETSSLRDPNVSDEVWTQLQRDILANQELEKSVREEIEAKEQDVRKLQEEERAAVEAISKLERLRQEKHKSEEEDDELRRKFEQERLRALQIKRAKDEEAERLRKLQEEEQKRRQEEAKVQKKLRDMGVCPVGFRWIKQSNGYRCAGGSHFITNAALGI